VPDSVCPAATFANAIESAVGGGLGGVDVTVRDTASDEVLSTLSVALAAME